MDAPKVALNSALSDVASLSQEQVAKLRALSVTTVEEMLGLLAADPRAFASFVGIDDVPKLESDAAKIVGAALLEVEEVMAPSFSMGALAPEHVQVEQQASAATFEAYSAAAAAPPPAAADASPPEPAGVSLVAFFGPVRDQGDRGTCVAHATCALLECRTKQTAGADLDLSEQFGYWDAKQHDGRPDAEGTFISVAMNDGATDGICLETDWAYNPAKVPGNESQGPPPDGAQAAAAGHLVTNPTALNAQSSADIKSVLDQQRPAAISIPVYRNWYDNPATRLYGTIPMPLPDSELVGGHALCVAGYGIDADFTGGGYFIVRNSWGTVWAAQSQIAPGYGALPFAYVDNYGWEAATAD